MSGATNDAAAIPRASLVFGFVPMLPFVAGAIGAWALPMPWSVLALRLSQLWGALILAFIAGVRRGFGFGRRSASTGREIGAMLVYFTLAGLALVAATFARAELSLVLLLTGYALVAMCDVAAARVGDAPRHFAQLRGPQMAIAVAALIALLVRAAHRQL